MVAKLGSAFSVLPFDKADTLVGTSLTDEFLNTIANADLDGAVTVTSEITWVGDEGGGDSAPAVANVTGVANHPGIISLATGATTPADGDIAGLTLANTVLVDDNDFYMGTIIRIPDVSDTKVSFGLTATRTEAVNSSAANVVALVFDPEDAANVGDAMFFLQLNIGGTDQEVVFDQALVVENEWLILELAVNDTRVVARVTVDGDTTQPTTQVKELAGAMATALLPGYLVEAVGAAEELINVDKFVARYLRKSMNSLLGA